MTRFLSEQEITRLAAALDAEARASGNPFPRAAIKLLLFTGCRRRAKSPGYDGNMSILSGPRPGFDSDSKTGAKKPST